MWQIESHTSWGWRCTSACMARHRIICLSCVHRSLKLLNDIIFVPPAAIYSSFHVSARYLRPSHLRCRWTNDMELVPKQFAWARHANWLFSSYTEDMSFWSVLGTLSTLEALLATMRYINWHLHSHYRASHSFSATAELLTCTMNVVIVFRHKCKVVLCSCSTSFAVITQQWRKVQQSKCPAFVGMMSTWPTVMTHKLCIFLCDSWAFGIR